MRDFGGEMIMTGIKALVSARPDLSAEQLLVGIVRAAREVDTPAARVKVAPVGAKPRGAAAPPAQKRTTEPAPPVAKGRPPAKRRAMRARRKPGRVAARSPLAKRTTRAKRKRPRLASVPVPPPKNFLRRLTGGKNSLLAAMDRAVDGMLTKYLEILDDGSPHLEALSRAAGRGHRWRFRSWREPISWVCPAGSTEWEKVDPKRVATVSEHMRDALTASAGGVDELTRRGLAWVDLCLPAETEAWHRYREWLSEGGDAFVSGGR